MVIPPPKGALLLPEIKVVSAENSRQLEKRFTFLWSSAHRLLATSDVLANHMIASMMQLARANHAQLPQSVLDFICERCGGLLVPSVSADVRVVPQSRKSIVNRRLARQQRRVQLQGNNNGSRSVRETVSTIVRVTCRRCQYISDRPGASDVFKAKTKKRLSGEKHQMVTIDPDTNKRKTDKKEAAENDDSEVARRSVGSVELEMGPTGLFASVASSPTRKLLDGPKKRKKKKKTTQPDAAVIAVKNNLSSFLQGLDSRK